MANKVALYTHTLKYLKPTQVKYRLYYLLRNKLAGKSLCKLMAAAELAPARALQWPLLLTNNASFDGAFAFTFLNKPQHFKNSIDWNFDAFGKLWTYNLCYFDFLLQPSVNVEKAVALMQDYVQQYDHLKDGHEPYPTSLRLMNWIKFVALHEVDSGEIHRAIQTDLARLRVNLEWHLMGNHLLENGFALLFGGCYLDDRSVVNEAIQILEAQLEEQILANGAHFELSPMYHQTLLGRVLDCINLLANNPTEGTAEFLTLLQAKASKMVGWLQAITFSNGDIPHVNDSVDGIAPNTGTLLDYARKLGIVIEQQELGVCGYRKFHRPDFELLVDVGNIGPNYIPGHAHSDTLNFVLFHKGQPLIVDTGISTYEKNQQRQSERSTTAHNTVMVANQDQSQVWGGFRVACRAESKVLSTDENQITASHNGYQSLGVVHQRTFDCGQESVIITDQLSQSFHSEAFLHFHPNVTVQVTGNRISGDFGTISFEGSDSIQTNTYQYAFGFNKTAAATLVTITFFSDLKTTIQFA